MRILPYMRLKSRAASLFSRKETTPRGGEGSKRIHTRDRERTVFIHYCFGGCSFVRFLHFRDSLGLVILVLKALVILVVEFLIIGHIWFNLIEKKKTHKRKTPFFLWRAAAPTQSSEVACFRVRTEPSQGDLAVFKDFVSAKIISPFLWFLLELISPGGKC